MPELPVAAQTLVRRAPSLHERRVGDKVFVLDSQSVMHALENDVAVAIWDLIGSTSEAPVSVDAITQRVVEAFDVAPKEASCDVVAFLETLRARGLVEASD